MKTMVALLRGINVGTAKRVAMADLRAVCEGLGHSEVRTLLNSGNVVFRTKAGTPSTVGSALEKAIVKELGVASKVTVLTSDELEAIAHANPFKKHENDASRLVVAVLAEPALKARLKEIAARAWDPEAFGVAGRAAYLWCPNGQAESPLAKAVWKVLGDGTTARNWATLVKLRALASNPARA